MLRPRPPRITAVGIAMTLSLATLDLMSGDASAGTQESETQKQSDAACSNPGQWLDARDGRRLVTKSMADGIAGKAIVLLGETHDNAEHHRWQLHTLAALHGRTKKLILGFEMFPRNAQDHLDRWVSGEISEKAFLKAVKWNQTWGFDPDLYMPLFHYARMHRLPMVALNVERQFISRVGAEGWDAIPADERLGLTDPAQATPEYLRSLAEVYAAKLRLTKGTVSSSGHGSKATGDTASSPSIDDILALPRFKLFVGAQLTWDRAMAEALSTAQKKDPKALVVGIMGSGHVSYFHGVPHQLKDLGQAGAAVLMPVNANAACALVGVGYADALFTVEQRDQLEPKPKRPRLGVFLQQDKTGVRVERVVPDSVAANAKIQTGDRILRAAGVEISDTDSLIAVIVRQAPGTWLPLLVERSGSKLELIARFPVNKEDGQ